MKRQFVRWRLAQTPYNLNQRGRRVREDVRVKEEWLNPGGRELLACREANIKLWRANNRRLSAVLITTRRDQRDPANVLSPIRIHVNSRMQLRRDATEERPAKRCENNARDESTCAAV